MVPNSFADATNSEQNRGRLLVYRAPGAIILRKVFPRRIVAGIATGRTRTLVHRIVERVWRELRGYFFYVRNMDQEVKREALNDFHPASLFQH